MSNRYELLKYLKSMELMVIATMSERPTACAVYYGVDDLFKFYIVTSPSTEHGKNILANGKIACSITDSHQAMFQTKLKIGAQIYGTAKQLVDEKEMREALYVWSKGNEELVKTYMKNISENIWESRPFVIKPTEIKWFNEDLYGDEGIEVFKF